MRVTVVHLDLTWMLVVLIYAVVSSTTIILLRSSGSTPKHVCVQSLLLHFSSHNYGVLIRFITPQNLQSASKIISRQTMLYAGALSKPRKYFVNLHIHYLSCGGNDPV